MIRSLFLMLAAVAIFAIAGCASDRGGSYAGGAPSFGSGGGGGGGGGGSCPSCQ